MIQNLFNVIILLMLLAGYRRNYKLWKGEEVMPRKTPTQGVLVFGLIMILWAVALIVF